MTTSWAKAVSGIWETAANWTNGVPAPGGTALLTVSGHAYTVTADGEDAFGVLDMAKNATLLNNDDFDITLGTGTGALAGTVDVGSDLVFGADATDTTFNNTGTFNFEALGRVVIAGMVTLIGKGKINLVDPENIGIISDGTTVTLTNGNASSANTISGVSKIGDSHMTFVNSAKGIVDADVDNNNDTQVLEIAAASVTNAGLMEATANGLLYVTDDISQTGKGTLKAAQAGSTVWLYNAQVLGGLVSVAKNAVLETLIGTGLISTTTPIKNAGEILAEGDFQISDSIQNSGTLAVDNSRLYITGAVTGGQAEITGTGTLDFGGPSSAKVTFETNIAQPTNTGMLILGDPAKFTGTVAGMAASPGASIDLENIAFSDGPIVNYNPKTHLLTVTDQVAGITDKIKISGPAGTFTPSMALDGTTLISDPSAAPATVPNNGAQLLAQSMASFGATSGVAGSGTGSLAEHHTSPDFLAANSHHR